MAPPRKTKVEQKKEKDLAARRALQSLGDLMAGRSRFLKTAGLQYGGKRDIYKVAGYTAQGEEKFDDYWALYDRDPIAGRIVDFPAGETWKRPPLILDREEDETPTRRMKNQDTEFEKQFKDMAKRLRLWSVFERTDRLARVGRYSVLLIGHKDSEDTALKEPLTSVTGGPESILYVTPYSEKYAVINEWVTDTRDPRFGLPKNYKIDISGGVQGFQAKQLVVDASRVLHVAEDLLEDEVFGRPALKRALNPLFDLLKVTAATGESYWQVAVRILTAKLDPSMQFPEGTEKDAVTQLGEKLEEIVHDMRRQFVGHGAELGWLQAETPDPSQVMELFMAVISVAAGVPKRIFWGSERGELASSQDERNWYGQVHQRQGHFAEPMLVRAFIDKMIALKALPEPTVNEYIVQWPQLFEQTDKENAETNQKRAETANKLTPVGGDPRRLVDIDEEGNVKLRPGATSEEELEKETKELEEQQSPPGGGQSPEGMPSETEEEEPDDDDLPEGEAQS